MRLDRAHLLVVDEGKSADVALGDAPLTIGRASENDLVLASRFVSARHARIEPAGDSHRIVDLGSTNGLLYEGRRLTPNEPLRLSDGDLLRIGDVATGGFVTLTYHNPQAPRARRGDAAAHRYPLAEGDAAITIGRAGNDIVLDNPQVSRRHAVIERVAGRHVLRDVGSTNGTFVNGQRITQHALAPGEIIQIGAYKLVYDGAALAEYDQRGALRLDARGIWREVEGAAGPRAILRDVSLAIAPREFVAIVGGSGAGKSTLLNALAGFAPAERGSVLVNGDDYYANFDAYRAMIGYVPQEDILHRALPAGQALAFAADLRLPADTAPAEVAQRIDRVLDDVEMAEHRATPIDRLSGGQRKRISIASELLADPSLFFLDEPTSGLDPGLEKKLMYTMRRLADSGRTVMLVTHATAAIGQCDLLVFLADGRMVFCGPPGDAPAFFQVADGAFADIYTKLEGRADPADTAGWAVAQRDLLPEYTAWSKAHPGASPPRLAELWETKFRASPAYARFVTARLAEAPAGPVAAQSPPAARRARPRNDAVRQGVVLARRYAQLLLADRRNLAILLLQAPLIGALIALVARSDAIVGERANAAEAKKALVMLAVVAVWFGVINAAREIAKELPVLRRERLAGLRIAPYLLAKVGVLTLLVVAQALVLLGLVALRVQLPAWGVLLPTGVELFVTTTLTAFAGLALGLAISAFARTPDRAISIVPLVLIPQILFAGVIFGLGDGVTLQRILSWLTFSRWAMDAYGATVDLNALPLAPGMLPLPAPPAEYAATAATLLSRWGMLLAYAIACLGLAWWRLRSGE
jgi:ABC-type multidrug transport system ATPase subunit/pSer/pThr/pTyr-binding forkhead associated (FHA) protein